MNINKEAYKFDETKTRKEYMRKYSKTAKWKDYYKKWLEKNKGYHKNYYQNLKNKAQMYENNQRLSQSNTAEDKE